MPGDDGFSEVCGGGSVAWIVKVKSGNVVETERGRGWSYQAKDKDDLVDEPNEKSRAALYRKYFKIRILKPKDGEIIVRNAHGAVELFVRIEDRRPTKKQPRRQIKVSWAKPKGAGKNLLDLL